MNFRVYGGFHDHGLGLGRRLPSYGVDVNARFENCIDGTIEISALDIGGLLYEPDETCGYKGWAGSVSGWPDKAESEIDSEQTSGNQVANDKTIRCDPATWNCRTVGR